jgi:hypothetical protein
MVVETAIGHLHLMRSLFYAAGWMIGEIGGEEN